MAEVIKDGRLAHALLLPFPTQGHIGPMLELGRRLGESGVQVTMPLTKQILAKVAPKAEASTKIRMVNLVSIADGLPDDFNRDVFSEKLLESIMHNLQDPILDLVHALSKGQCPITCIVSDFFLEWTSSLATQVGHLPEFVFWSQSTTVFSIYASLDSLKSNGYDPFKVNVDLLHSNDDINLSLKDLNNSGIFSCVYKDMEFSDLPFSAPFGTYGLNWIKNILESRFKENHYKFIIGNSIPELEPDFNPNIPIEKGLRLVGPLLPQYNTLCTQDEEDECMQWLSKQPPSSVLYVSFGSLTQCTMRQMHELAWGLVSSKQNFLWVIRRGFISDLKQSYGVELNYLPEGFLAKIMNSGKVVQWAPQHLVLSHPSIAGFFSHCGWNSTLESIKYGVPILAWPRYLDQITNTWLITHHWRVGLQLKPANSKLATHDEICHGVCQLIVGPNSSHFKSRADMLKEKVQLELPQNSSRLRSLVETILQSLPN